MGRPAQAVGADHVRARADWCAASSSRRAQIVWASSNRRDEQLGVILRRAADLSHERALADALEARAETGVPLGKVLLMSD